jgi:hypothetical protein
VPQPCPPGRACSLGGQTTKTVTVSAIRTPASTQPRLWTGRARAHAPWPARLPASGVQEGQQGHPRPEVSGHQNTATEDDGDADGEPDPQRRAQLGSLAVRRAHGAPSPVRPGADGSRGVSVGACQRLLVSFRVASMEVRPIWTGDARPAADLEQELASARGSTQPPRESHAGESCQEMSFCCYCRDSGIRTHVGVEWTMRAQLRWQP